MANFDDLDDVTERETPSARRERRKREQEKARQVTAEAEAKRRAKVAEQQKKYRGFANHLIIFIALMALAVPLNINFLPDKPYWIFFLMGWGVILFIHGIAVSKSIWSNK